MAAILIALQADNARRALRRERTFLPRSAPGVWLDTLNDQEFVCRYRVSKEVASDLIYRLSTSYLGRRTGRSHAVGNDVKV